LQKQGYTIPVIRDARRGTNPILDFGVDQSCVQYAGRDLQRPECILAERDGTLWAADARGGVYV